MTALIRLSQLAVEVPAVRSIDIDPLLCGKGHAIVLDAHCVIGSDTLTADENASHLIFPYRPSFEKNVRGKYGLVKIKYSAPEDKENFLKYLGSLSDQSRRLRFHSLTSSLESIAVSAVSSDPDRSFSFLPWIRTQTPATLLPKLDCPSCPTARPPSSEFQSETIGTAEDSQRCSWTKLKRRLAAED
mgnify:CR=1 FL=1